MEKILSLRDDPNAIVLDSFLGTAFTSHKILKLNKNDGDNRKFILVELENYVEEIRTTRIKKASLAYEFHDKKKEILKRFSIKTTNLKKAEKILEEFESLQENAIYSKVSIESINGHIAITAEKEVSGKTEGLGGAFEFYEVGLPLCDQQQNLNKVLNLPKIKEVL